MKALLKEKKKLDPKLLVIAVTAVSIALLISIFILSKSIPQEFLIPAKSRLSTVPLNVKGGGVISTESIDFISAPYSGIVENVSVKEGQFVQSQQALVMIKNHELELELVESKFSRDDLAADAKLQTSKLKQSKLNKASELKKLAAIRALKQTEMQAIRELEQQGIVSKLDSRKAELELSLAQLELESKQEEFKLFSESYLSQIESLGERVETKNKKLNFLSNLIASLEMKSDISGLIKHVAVQKGQVVSHGEKLFEIINPNNLVAKVSIPQYSSADLKVGQLATVVTPNGSLQGKVEYIDNVVRAGAINVSITFEGKTPPWLRLEQSVEAIIQTDKEVSKSIVRKPSNYKDYKAWAVYKIDNEELAIKVDYKLVDRGDGYLDVIGQTAVNLNLILVPEQFSSQTAIEL